MPSANVNFPLPMTRLLPFYPGQMGVPGSDNDRGLRLDTNGQVFYVDPNKATANTSNDGTDPDHPLSTVAAALNKCNSYHNDVIAVMFNSDWTYSTIAAGHPLPIQESVTVNKAGVRIVGVAPSGALGVPWIPTANNAVCITVNAMDVLIEGFCFWDSIYTGNTAIYAQWSGAAYYGENLTVRNNHFYNMGYGVVMDYSYNCHIHDNRFEDIVTQAIHGSATFGNAGYNSVYNNEFWHCAGAINLPDSDYNKIVGNYFMNNTVAIAMTGDSDYNMICKNVIQGNAAGTNNYINLSGNVGADLNIVADNWLGCTVAQYDTTCSPGGGGTDMWVRNHCQNGETTANPT